MQRQYRRAREQVNELLRSAMEGRAQAHNEEVNDDKIEAEAQVWLYLDLEGYARKLAHLWHGRSGYWN